MGGLSRHELVAGLLAGQAGFHAFLAAQVHAVSEGPSVPATSAPRLAVVADLRKVRRLVAVMIAPRPVAWIVRSMCWKASRALWVPQGWNSGAMRQQVRTPF